MKQSLVILLFMVVANSAAFAQKSPKQWHSMIKSEVDELNEKVIDWRRHLHQNPELSNQEVETAAYIESHLRNLGLEVHTGIARTGVVGVLKGGKKGPTLGLRADMDALPVTERVDLPFKSTKTSTYLGKEVGVMHACGHDTHVAMLMGVVEIFAKHQKNLPGTLVFVFQPAEEGSLPGQEGGAKLMVKEGIISKFNIEAMFGLHINSLTEVGTIKYKPEGTMAAADVFNITVHGKQTHGSTPWTGADPIVTSAKIIDGLQTIISRKTELTRAAAVISVGKIESGVRNNIIPEKAEMIGTIRTLDVDMQDKIHAEMEHVATTIATSMGATAEVSIEKIVPVTYNDPELTSQMVPSLEKVAGKENVLLMDAMTGAEDFSFFQKEIPGFYFFVGGMPKGMKSSEAAPHHTPDFYIDESGLSLGVHAMASLAIDYLYLNRN